MEDIIWIADSVRRELLRHQSEFFPLETGGILLGYFTEESNKNHWVVTSATGPGDRAKHGRYRFTPDDEYHVLVAKQHYHLTGGKEYYLGDWHTHPNGSSRTSILDRLTLNQNAKRADHLLFRSLMLIIGGGTGTPEYGVYVEKARKNLLKTLIPIQALDFNIFH